LPLKEANETLYWIELLHQSEYIDDKTFESNRLDSEDLVKLLASIVKTSKATTPLP
jgi:four helix bundle protein